MIPRRVTVDNVDDVLGSRGRARRPRSARLVGLVVIAGLLAFGLWRSDLFGRWAGGASEQSGPTTTFYLGEGATIMDRAEAVGTTWYLIAQPTTDGRLCYQVGDSDANVVFSCTGVGLTPVATDTNEVASVVIPALVAEGGPPVIIGSVAPSVARIEVRVNDVVQRVAPVDWPELKRNGFIAPIDLALARELPAPMTIAAYNANGDCVGAVTAIPTGQLRLENTKACPKK